MINGSADLRQHDTFQALAKQLCYAQHPVRPVTGKQERHPGFLRILVDVSGAGTQQHKPKVDVS